MKKKLGKNCLYQKGTLVAYGCSTCYCYCGTCTNCNTKNPTELVTYATQVSSSTTSDMKGLPFTL